MTSISKLEGRAGLPQTICKGSLQTTLCCINWKQRMWWMIMRSGAKDSCRYLMQSWRT